MAGMKMTPSRRSQLVEMLMKQNQEQWAQNPQTGLETALKMAAQFLRGKQANQLRETEAAATKTRGANEAAALAEALGEQPQSVFGTPLPGQQAPGSMREHMMKTNPESGYGPMLAGFELKQKMATTDPTKQKLERVPLELTEDVPGVGKAGKTVMGVFRANPSTGEAEYLVNGRPVPGTSARPPESRQATRDANLSQAQRGKVTEDLAKKNQTQAQIDALKGMDFERFLTVGGKLNVFTGTWKDKLNLPFWQLNEEERKELSEAQAFNGTTSQLFQAIRTEVTGAQAAMVELRYLEQAYLSNKMGPTQFRQALSLLDNMNSLAIKIKTDMLKQGFNAIGPDGQANPEFLQEFGNRFDDQWEGGKAFEVVPPNEAMKPEGIPEGWDPEDWNYLTEEEKASLR